MRLIGEITERKSQKQDARPKAAGPRFTLEVSLPPGIDAETARKLTERAVCAALAEGAGS